MKGDKVFLLMAIVFFLTVTFMKRIWVQNTFDRRCQDLGLMRYNSELDKFVLKDSVEFDKWDLHYIKYGTMNK